MVIQGAANALPFPTLLFHLSLPSMFTRPTVSAGRLRGVWMGDDHPRGTEVLRSTIMGLRHMKDIGRKPKQNIIPSQTPTSRPARASAASRVITKSIQVSQPTLPTWTTSHVHRASPGLGYSTCIKLTSGVSDLSLTPLSRRFIISGV